MGNWVKVNSEYIYEEEWSKTDVYLSIEITSTTIVRGSVYETRYGHWYSVRASSIPIGTKVRARFSGYISGESKYVTTKTLTVGTNGKDDVLIGKTRPANEIYSVDGWLYIEKYEPTPPSTPSSISVPTTIKGGESITISWGSSSGATSYRLQRSVNGGTWTQIYSGSSRSYTDTITKGWKTVAYRVRAYNSDGYSDYITSPTRTVINFPEMQIKINGVLKTSDAGWVRVNGQLREIDTIWVKINGAIKEVQ